jgi:alkylhydroperoxidase family enzyme
MDRRNFVQGGIGLFAVGGLDANSLQNSSASKAGASSSPVVASKPAMTADMLPLLSLDESARLSEKVGIARDLEASNALRDLGTSNVFRGLLHSPSAAAGFYGLLSALLFHNKVAARTRELVILRIGWRTGSEYVFCNHVQFSRQLGLRDEEILGVRDPQRCSAYSDGDRAVLRLADELHEHAEVTPSTWAALGKAFATNEVVELLLAAGFWRMAAGFVKSAKIPLDAGVPSWPEGKKPENAAPEKRRSFPK